MTETLYGYSIDQYKIALKDRFEKTTEILSAKLTDEKFNGQRNMVTHVIEEAKIILQAISTYPEIVTASYDYYKRQLKENPEEAETTARQGFNKTMSVFSTAAEMVYHTHKFSKATKPEWTAKLVVQNCTNNS